MNAARILGVMSGSSLDGLDLAVCAFAGDPSRPQWEIVRTRHVPYPPDWKGRLADAPGLSGRGLMKLDADYGRLIGGEALALATVEEPVAELIASHGHTVFHEPGSGFTTQIGDGAWIAAITGLDTVTSFRGQDVALGGQGAPFAPAADIALFPEYRAHLNLGGIANIHIHHAGGTRMAWDIGPCNQALNFLAGKIGQSYDPEGSLARSGTVDGALLEALLSLFPPTGGQPLGLSNDMVRSAWIELLDGSSLDPRHLLATCTEAIARMIAAHMVDAGASDLDVLVTGGGAFNEWLMDRLRSHGSMHGFRFTRPSDTIIQFKECLLMAYLGWLVRLQRPFGLAGLTGARAESIGGAYYFGRHGA